jgi:hypothetical protein
VRDALAWVLDVRASARGCALNDKMMKLEQAMLTAQEFQNRGIVFRDCCRDVRTGTSWTHGHAAFNKLWV